MSTVFAILFCPGCWCKTEFCLASDAAPGDMQPPIECWECDYRYECVLVKYDQWGVRLEVPYSAYPIDSDILEQGREEIRRRTWQTAVGSGYDLGVFRGKQYGRV